MHIIDKAIYGLRSSGKRWHERFFDVLRDMGFHISKADNDVWMQRAVKSDGTPYYEYILVYTDDFLILSMDPWAIIKDLQKEVTLKDTSIKEPDQYLGASVSKYEFKDGGWCWAMGSDQYVKEAIRNAEMYCDKHGLFLKTGKYAAKTVFPTKYRPELDFTKECGDEDITFF